MRGTLVALLLFLGCKQAPLSTDRVVVRNSEMQVIRTIDQPVPLAEFTELWRTRQPAESSPGNLSAYPFKLDIAAKEDSGRWLYHPDGFTTILSVKQGADVYIIPDAHSFNAILGLDEEREALEHR